MHKRRLNGTSEPPPKSSPAGTELRPSLSLHADERHGGTGHHRGRKGTVPPLGDGRVVLERGTIGADRVGLGFTAKSGSIGVSGCGGLLGSPKARRTE